MNVHSRPAQGAGDEEQTQGHSPPASIAGRLRFYQIDVRMLAMLAVIAVIWIGLDIMTGGIFLSARNLYNLAVQSSVIGIMATGMVLVIVCRHIDLSVGSVLAFTGMVITWLQVDVLPVAAAWNWPLTVVIGLVVGGLIGAWQGYWVAYRGVPAFVVTLAGLLIFRGGAYLVTSGQTVAPLNETYQVLGGGLTGSIGATWSWVVGLAGMAGVVALALRQRRSRARHGFPLKPMWLEALLMVAGCGLIAAFVLVMNAYEQPNSDIARGIPVPVLILIAAGLVMTWLARATPFGRHVFALGGNPEAAALVGIKVKRTTLTVFIIMGVLAALAAVVQTARLNAGTNSMGQLAELSVIAAAVIGGTSLAGGVGSIAGALLGTLIMQSLENGMVLIGTSSAVRMVVIGLMLIVAVWVDNLHKKRAG